MIERVLDIIRFPNSGYFNVISRQEGTLEDCKELKMYYENLESERDNLKVQVKQLQEEISELTAKDRGLRASYIELYSERDNLKEKIEKIKEISNRDEVKTGYEAEDKIELIKKEILGVEK